MSLKHPFQNVKCPVARLCLCQAIEGLKMMMLVSLEACSTLLGEAHDRLLLRGRPVPLLNIFSRKWIPGGPWKAPVNPNS